jgi:hypothetical protein
MTEWGDKIIITDKSVAWLTTNHPLFKEAIKETREQMAAHALGLPYLAPKWTWKDRLSLVWAVLRGEITWSDIN